MEMCFSSPEHRRSKLTVFKLKFTLKKYGMTKISLPPTEQTQCNGRFALSNFNSVVDSSGTRFKNLLLTTHSEGPITTSFQTLSFNASFRKLIQQVLPFFSIISAVFVLLGIPLVALRYNNFDYQIFRFQITFHYRAYILDSTPRS